MKTHDQVLCNFESHEIYGGANCPFCGKRSQLFALKKWVMAAKNCEHVDMAVDAGFPKIAIHFRIGS